MPKLIHITKCRECPRCEPLLKGEDGVRELLVCEETHRILLGDAAVIPEWCPLPEAK